MSFILDALKKLEREKQVREPGVVMVGPVPWGGVDRRRRARTLVLATAALVALAAGAVWWLWAAPAPTPAPPEGHDGAAVQPAAPPPTDESPTALAPPAASEVTPAPPPIASRPAAAAAAARLPAPDPPELDLPVEPMTAPLSEPAVPDETTPPAAAKAALDQRLEAAPADPPTEENPALEPEFRLTAISTRDGEPIALLNDRLVREGDRFGGVRVIRIGVADVEIEVDGQRRTIGF